MTLQRDVAKLLHLVAGSGLDRGADGRRGRRETGEAANRGKTWRREVAGRKPYIARQTDVEVSK